MRSALLHSYRPSLIPLKDLSPANPTKNLELAFAAAESLGIGTTSWDNRKRDAGSADARLRVHGCYRPAAGRRGHARAAVARQAERHDVPVVHLPSAGSLNSAPFELPPPFHGRPRVPPPFFPRPTASFINLSHERSA